MSNPNPEYDIHSPLRWLQFYLFYVIVGPANRCHKVQRWHSSTRLNRRHTKAPLAAAIRSMCDLGAQLTASWNQLYAGFCRRGKSENPEKNPWSREENQHKLNALMASGPGINLGHIGGRRVLSPLCYPCSPLLLSCLTTFIKNYENAVSNK